MDYNKAALELHSKFPGKIAVQSLCECKDRDALSTAYTPGVAEPCRKIKANPDDVYTYTMKGRTVAVVTNGTAVLGLGNIGPEAGLPVMEGKCVLFKEFGGVDAFPICLNAKTKEEVIAAVKAIAPTFGGINLEDIAAPRCFEIERKLKELCDIPIFHDDQHGTAVVVLAALTNALKVVGKKIEDITLVTSGAGAAGVAIVKLLMAKGLKNVILCNSKGAIYEGKPGLSPALEEMAKITNRGMCKGTLADALVGADVFLGVSAPGLVTGDMVRTMAKDPVIFACANPTPEIFPEEALAAGARVVGTGRSDYPNQINNVLAVPGIFRGALDVRAKEINDEMKVAAAQALA
uniref:NAD(P)-dependent malic enzyme n=1 Tax=Gemmiger formicilis TaxID=745368 RepID=UPI00402A03C4